MKIPSAPGVGLFGASFTGDFIGYWGELLLRLGVSLNDAGHGDLASLFAFWRKFDDGDVDAVFVLPLLSAAYRDGLRSDNRASAQHALAPMVTKACRLRGRAFPALVAPGTSDSSCRLLLMSFPFENLELPQEMPLAEGERIGQYAPLASRKLTLWLCKSV
jgi:hypothetical protein